MQPRNCHLSCGEEREQSHKQSSQVCCKEETVQAEKKMEKNVIRVTNRAAKSDAKRKRRKQKSKIIFKLEQIFEQTAQRGEDPRKSLLQRGNAQAKKQK